MKICLSRPPRITGLRRGAAAVEMAFLLPILALFIVGVWEVGRMVEVQQIMNNAAREGARQASTGSKDVAGVKDVVVRYLTQNGISKVTAEDVTVTNMTDKSRNDPMTATQLDRWQVSVKVPFNNVRWAVMNSLTNTEYLAATADWVSTRDIPISVNADIPLN